MIMGCVVKVNLDAWEQRLVAHIILKACNTGDSKPSQPHHEKQMPEGHGPQQQEVLQPGPLVQPQALRPAP